MPFLKKLWYNYALSNLPLKPGSLGYSRTLFINIFSAIGFCVELSFGLLNLNSGYFSAAAVEIGAASVMFANLMALRHHGKINAAARLLLVASAAPLMTMLLTNTPYNTGIFWLPAFPIAAYLILGKRQGSTALLILMLVIGTMSLFESLQLVDLAYSYVSIRQMIISLLILAVLMYVHENLREQGLQLAEERAIAFRAAYQKVRQTEKARDEFTATLAHELRNSFVAIQKLAETWRSQLNTITPKKSREYIDLIHQSSTDNLGTINSLLDIVNIEQATFTVNKRLGSLRDIIRQQVGLFTPQAEQAGVTLDVVFDDEIPWQLPIDTFRIKEVLANLISNAIKHTARGNTATVQAIKAVNADHLFERAKELKLKWFMSPEDPKLHGLKDFVWLGVSHAEAGLHREDIPKLFKKFSRLQPKDQLHPPQGHGLGLYIIRRIIESHSGTYGVASRASQGVTFYVTLPVEEPSPKITHA